jgi:septum formation protein
VIVLASRSPRRRELLDRLAIPYKAEPADVDESRRPAEQPKDLAIRLAREKAMAVARRRPNEWVLAADTVVVLGDDILGKPVSPEGAMRMLERLSGREHRVITAVALVRGDEIHERCDVTRVWFRRLDPELISAYVATGEPLDKAGSYGLQGRGAVLVDRIEGDYFGVIGLPLRLVVDLFEAAGIPYTFTR